MLLLLLLISDSMKVNSTHLLIHSLLLHTSRFLLSDEEAHLPHLNQVGLVSTV